MISKFYLDEMETQRGGIEDRGGNKQERGPGKQDKKQGEVLNPMGDDSPCCVL